MSQKAKYPCMLHYESSTVEFKIGSWFTRSLLQQSQRKPTYRISVYFLVLSQESYYQVVFINKLCHQQI